MRILFVSPEAGLGGAERCLLDLVDGIALALPRAEPRVLFLAEGPLVDAVRARGVPVRVLPMPESLATMGESRLRGAFSLGGAAGAAGHGLRAGAGAVKLLAALRRAIVDESPAVLHSNGIKSHALVGMLGLRGIPIVWHLHDFIGAKPVAARALRFFSATASAAIANSEAVAADARRIFPRLDVIAVPNGVDTQLFRPGPREDLPLDEPPGEALRVGLVATYARWKGHRLFLEAAASPVLAARDGLRFFIVGGPVYRVHGSQCTAEELSRTAATLGVAGRVRLVPFRDPVAGVFRALDIVVHASTEPEPFGRVIIEAMASGKPVVVAGAGGAREIVTDGVDGLVYAPGDPGALAGAIDRLARDAGLRARLGRNARRTVELRFSRERFVAGVSDVLAHQVERPELVIAMGYEEDRWHSMRRVAVGLYETLRRDGHFGVALHAPRCGRPPRAVDRRARYPLSLPRGRVLVLMDHSYGDSLLAARGRFDHVVAVVNDIAFWRTRRAWNGWARARISAGLAAADLRVAISRAVASEMERELGLVCDAVIPPGIPIEAFPHDPGPRDPHRLLHVGGTSERKGIDRLLRLLARLPSHFRLRHAGEPLTSEQKRLAAELGLLDRIDADSDPDDASIARYYREAAVLVVPSRYEGFGMPAVEARLTGTSVVLSEAVPAIELLRDDEGTLAVDFAAFDPEGEENERESIARRIVGLAAAPPRALSGRGRFGWDAVARQYLDLLDPFSPFPVAGEVPAALRR